MVCTYTHRHDTTYRPKAQRVNIFIIAMCVVMLALYYFADICVYSDMRAHFISQLDEAPHTSYIVRHGDSLWTIAQDISQTAEQTASVCAWLETYNNLKGVKLTEGQMIYIPCMRFAQIPSA